MIRLQLLGIFFFMFRCNTIKAQNIISLSGLWKVKIDPTDQGIQRKWYNDYKNTQFINLPGTLDDAGIGYKADTTKTDIKQNLLYSLTRKTSFIGAAWYYKEIFIPKDWQQKKIILSFERVLWSSAVWIDGQLIDSAESLSVPHVFNIKKYLAPGKHLLVVRIDNRKRYDISVKNLAHAYTDGTQIIWNGIIGSMTLSAQSALSISRVNTYPDVKNKTVKLGVFVLNNTDKEINTAFQIQVLKNNKNVVTKKIFLKIIPGLNNLSETLYLGAHAQLWSEFNPVLYKVKANIASNADSFTTYFGLREIKRESNKILLNSIPIFLRGTLECNIFPINGHPPMEYSGWIKVFLTAKSYGLNHLRFHSWCPPEAAFLAADSLGFYIQIELPQWRFNCGRDFIADNFIYQEAIRISDQYGNHPSFLFWSLGNELEGDFEWLQNLLVHLKKYDNRHIYTTTTFTFQKGHGKWPEPVDDFWVTQITKLGWVRGQGIFNVMVPDFSSDYSKSVAGLQVPLITHEIGQYSVYPSLKQIDKYSGVLQPYNLKIIGQDLIKKNMYGLADSFTLASGHLAANLYKEEIERVLKTDQISGFQLLDLHDFPGQGTAHVGILDAFWDSKGIISPMQHRMYCAPVVPLLRFSKAVYENDESFVGSVEIINYSNKILIDKKIRWSITDKGVLMAKGFFLDKKIEIGKRSIAGQIVVSLKQIKQAKQLNLNLSIGGTAYKNQWNIWVYPHQTPISDTNIFCTRSLIKAVEAANMGKKVLFNPDTSQIKGVSGIFTPVFWSPLHFTNQPGSMGILCNPKHPVFKFFPTEYYSNWQWWDLIKSSKSMNIDSLPNIIPLVRVIDNFANNRKLANLFEARMGKGLIVITSMNLFDSLPTRPVARQLKLSLINYMNTKSFAPAINITESQLASLINRHI